MAVKNYLINDKWLDIDKQNIVEVKSTDGVIGSVKLNGEEYGGGGGSSDFSTATVTIINNNEEVTEISWGSCPMLNESYNLLTGAIYADTFPAVFTVPLYKGKCYWDHGARGLTLSGNIEAYDEGMLITGDCTITIS